MKKKQETEQEKKSLDELFAAAGSYRKSKKYFELLDFIRRFPDLAPYNAMLIHIQRPGSQYVLTATKWQKEFGRHIVSGARPMVILRPFGPVSFVFDISDTAGGRPVPESLINPFNSDGEIKKTTYKNRKIPSFRGHTV